MSSTQAFTSRRSVTVGLFAAIAQTVALAVAASVTGSAARKTQTATNLAEVAVGVFLLIGVVSSDRPPDDSHPLGYGGERFSCSFVAAVGIFVGGVGTAAVETPQAAVHPRPTASYLLGYAVLAVVMGLDALALTVGVRPLLRGASERHLSLVRFLWRGTDPVITTVVLSSAAGLAGGIVAATGLDGRELTGQTAADALASASDWADPARRVDRTAAHQPGTAHRPRPAADPDRPDAGPGRRTARRPGRARPVRNRGRAVQPDRRRRRDLRGWTQRPPRRADHRRGGHGTAHALAIAYVYLNPVAEHRHRQFAPAGSRLRAQP